MMRMTTENRKRALKKKKDKNKNKPSKKKTENNSCSDENKENDDRGTPHQITGNGLLMTKVNSLADGLNTNLSQFGIKGNFHHPLYFIR
jgi:hypothetical protein